MTELIQQALQLHGSGDLEQAEKTYHQILEKNPEHADALHLLGVLYSQTERHKRGSAFIEKAISINPSIAAFHANLGNTLYEIGKINEAESSFQNALQLDTGNETALNGLGMIHNAKGKYGSAKEYFRKIISQSPESPNANCNLGVAYWNLGNQDLAVHFLNEALRIRPHYPEALNNLGNVFWDQKDYDKSIQFLDMAVKQNPNYAEGYKNLAEKQWSLGDVEKAAEYYNKAFSLKSIDAWRIRSALMLPPIYHSLTEVNEYRQRLIKGVNELIDQDLSVKDQEDEIGPNFFSVYQGENDIDIQNKLGKIYRSAHISAEFKTKQKVSSNKLKVGFVSSFFHNHTIGKLNRGVIANLSRKLFHVNVFSIGSYNDDISRFIRKHSDVYFVLPKNLRAIQDVLKEQDLDILFYTDIGMEPLTYLLAFSRLAPIQCVTWGHPITTGIDTIDYFISTEDMETSESRPHYTENLVKLKSSPTYFYHPDLPAPLKNRENFNLPERKHIYVCPQTLFKFHPLFDKPIAEILRSDKDGIIVLISGKFSQWVTILKARFRESIPDVSDRILFLPQQTYQDFLNLLAISDVMLETFFFGGGNTTYEGLAAGVPIVSLPTEFLRGRITYAIYKKCGIMDCIASNPDEYIDIAFRLGTDPEYNQKIRKKISIHRDILYEDMGMVREMEQFFIRAADGHR